MVEQEFKISSEAEPMTYRQNSNNKRVLFFDQIKALMVALVIVIHALFALLFGWYGVRNPSEEFSDPLFQVAAGWYIYFCQTFFMYMLFLLSGYFVPRSVHKKGVAHYLKDRLRRIDIPFLIGLLLINNASWL